MLPALLLAVTAYVQHTFSGFGGAPRQVAFSPDSRLLAAASADGLVRLCGDGALVQSLAGHREDATVKLWSLAR